MSVYHNCTFALDLAEQEHEELPGPAPAEETNPEQEQDKPGASNPILVFYFLDILL
jgi:hypothetical protein